MKPRGIAHTSQHFQSHLSLPTHLPPKPLTSRTSPFPHNSPFAGVSSRSSPSPLSPTASPPPSLPVRPSSSTIGSPAATRPNGPNPTSSTPRDVPPSCGARARPFGPSTRWATARAATARPGASAPGAPSPSLSCSTCFRCVGRVAAPAPRLPAPLGTPPNARVRSSCGSTTTVRCVLLRTSTSHLSPPPWQVLGGETPKWWSDASVQWP
jgi:hypothetical protein